MYHHMLEYMRSVQKIDECINATCSKDISFWDWIGVRQLVLQEQVLVAINLTSILLIAPAIAEAICVFFPPLCSDLRPTKESRLLAPVGAPICCLQFFSK